MGSHRERAGGTRGGFMMLGGVVCVFVDRFAYGNRISGFSGFTVV